MNLSFHEYEEYKNTHGEFLQQISRMQAFFSRHGALVKYGEIGHPEELRFETALRTANSGIQKSQES